jgi:hypothetical protein
LLEEVKAGEEVKCEFVAESPEEIKLEDIIVEEVKVEKRNLIKKLFTKRR